MQSSNISHASSADRRITSRNRLKCIIEVYFEQRKNETLPTYPPPWVDASQAAPGEHLSPRRRDDFRRRNHCTNIEIKTREESCFKISIKYRSPLVYIVVKETDKYFTIFSLFFLTKYEDCRGKCIFVFSIQKEKFLHFLRTDSKIENAFISLFSPLCVSFHISCNISFPTTNKNNIIPKIFPILLNCSVLDI